MHIHAWHQDKTRKEGAVRMAQMVGAILTAPSPSGNKIGRCAKILNFDTAPFLLLVSVRQDYFCWGLMS